jgi:hypothetical protein
MRYTRVVAKNAQGLDLVAFNGPVSTTAPAVAILSGRVRRYSMAAYDYLNAVVLELGDGRYLCYSGLAFSGRAADGIVVERGAVLGQIEPATRTSILRARAHTAGVNAYQTPYLNVEAWSQLPPTFTASRGVGGTNWRPDRGFINPADFWSSLGIELVGAPGSQILAVRADRVC